MTVTLLQEYFFAASVYLVYTMEWAWLKDAESLECMQWCLGLLCLLGFKLIRWVWQKRTLKHGKSKLFNNKSEIASNYTLP